MPIQTLDSLLEEELKDLYDAEKRLVKALPKMAKAAGDDELKTAFQNHLSQTRSQVERLDEVFALLELKPKSKPCEGMKGLISEGEEAMEEDAAAPISDVMLITAAQKVEHYEISAYGTLKAIAEQMGEDGVVRLLDKTLAEEEEADQKLTEICQRLLGEARQSEEEEAA